MHEPTFLILCSLVPAPLHGYGIIGAVQELSGGRVRLRPGTLYTALERLAGEGLLAVDREEVVGGRLRRYHRITSRGREALEAEAARLEANAATARHRLGPGPVAGAA